MRRGLSRVRAMPGVFSLRDGELIQLAESPYETEDILQELVERFPALVSPEDDEPWILVRREAGVRFGERDGTVGSLDHLYLDAYGVPTLVEVKRASDTRIRREVVAQLLDYAANARHEWGQGRLRDWFEERIGATGRDPEEVLLEAFASVDDAEDYWQLVETNLGADRLRLVFVADQIPTSLRRIVEYLNRRMTATEVIAVEVRQFLDESGKHQMLVPSLVGETEASKATKGERETRRWDDASILASIESAVGAEARRSAQELLTWGHAEGFKLVFGRGLTVGSCSFGAPVGKKHFWTFAVWSDGNIELMFQHIRNFEPFRSVDERERLRVQLNQISGVDVPADRIEGRPPVPLGALGSPQAMASFTATIKAAVQRARDEIQS